MRSFSRGGSMGGGGGGVIRAVRRAVRGRISGGALVEPVPPSSTSSTANWGKSNRNPPNTDLTLSPCSIGGNYSSSDKSMPCSMIDVPTRGDGSSSTCSEESDWDFIEDFGFGNVPSEIEVQDAVAALQKVFSEDETDDEMVDEVSNSSDSELDWIEPSKDLSYPRMLSPCGSEGVYDAFHLLQTEPSVQRMVVSLSSDKAVWNAVMNNEAVKGLRALITQGPGDDVVKEISKDRSNDMDGIMGWIAVNVKAKMKQIIEQIMKVVNDVFQVDKKIGKEGSREDCFEAKVKISLLLSVLVVLVVVVTRAKRA